MGHLASHMGVSDLNFGVICLLECFHKNMPFPRPNFRMLSQEYALSKAQFNFKNVFTRICPFQGPILECFHKNMPFPRPNFRMLSQEYAPMYHFQSPLHQSCLLSSIADVEELCLGH